MPLFYVRIEDAVVYYSPMVLSAIWIPIQWFQPSVQQSNNILRFSKLNCKLQYTWTFMSLFAFAQATTVYPLPGTNHALIQVEYSDYFFCQCNYVNTAICNTTDIISALDNIANPVIAYNAYPDANLRCTPFSFMADTDSTS